MNISHRDQIGKLLKELQLKGDGAEIGIGWGAFSEIILNSWDGGNLYLIDPLVPMDDYKEEETNTEERHRRCRDKITSLLNQNKRAMWFPMRSDQAINLFGHDTFDFVYLDANHSYESAKADIPGWWEKVRPGGLLCGHDYTNEVIPPHRNCRVKDALDEWMVIHPELKLHTTECTSWWIRKPRQ